MRARHPGEPFGLVPGVDGRLIVPLPGRDLRVCGSTGRRVRKAAAIIAAAAVGWAPTSAARLSCSAASRAWQPIWGSALSLPLSEPG